MKYLKTYLSTAPVLAISSFIFLASLLIEINHFFQMLLRLLFFNCCPPLKVKGKRLC
jgi:hypothetical protein